MADIYTSKNIADEVLMLSGALRGMGMGLEHARKQMDDYYEKE